MDDKIRPGFATDLYRGTAAYYDRYRPPYPAALLTGLVDGIRSSGRGRLLDLACGTGQLTFSLRRRFAEAWAVDQEQEMVEAVRTKAAALGAVDVRPVVSSAEELDARPGSFESVVVGNAFHRFERDRVARLIHGWLEPGGHLALCWSSSPWVGEGSWQQALAAVLGTWRTALGAEDRIPADWDARRRRRSDVEVLSDNGFEVVGRREFHTEQRWSLPEIAGNIRSTSFLSAAVLGDRSGEFDAELAAVLGPYCDGDILAETATSAFDLARRA